MPKTKPNSETTTNLPALNALKHGVLSEVALLPWEDAQAYDAMLQALVEEHRPEGPVEEHLVEELSGIIWRKRRLRMAEYSYHHEQMNKAFQPFYGVVEDALVSVQSNLQENDVDLKQALTSNDTEAERKAIDVYYKPAKRCQEMLKGETTYEDALAVLDESTRGWWKDVLDGEVESAWEYEANAEDLAEFLENEVLPYYEKQVEELQHRERVRNYMHAHACQPNDKLLNYTRLEVHLDRKFERTLTVLLRMQEIRKNKQLLPAEG